MGSIILYWSFLLFIAIQCWYALCFFRRVFTLPDHIPTPPDQWRPVSIIICAKNEAANLSRNLPAILAQRYNKETGIALYEVIVVNDASGDDTAALLSDLRTQHAHLKVVTIGPGEQRNFPGKKYALSKGAAAASYDLLLLTDADCHPASDTWLQQMVAPLLYGKELVAGYGGYDTTGGLLNAFIRWETVHTFLQYSTYALAGKPYMAVGRNMACTKAALLRAQASSVWSELPSGDDDLLVRYAATSNNMALVDDTDAFTYSAAKTTWKDWARQKQRHVSTGKYYKSDIQLLLGGYGIAHGGMWVTFFLLLCTQYWVVASIILGVRCICYWFIWAQAAAKLKEKDLIYLFPLFDIGWLIYNFAFLPYITRKNEQRWK